MKKSNRVAVLSAKRRWGLNKKARTSRAMRYKC